MPTLPDTLPKLMPSDPVTPGYRRGATLIERIMAKTAVMPNGCWQWRGAMRTDGYGFLSSEGRNVRVHRAAYEVLVGAVPDGLVLDHLCRNRLCVNPEHLEPVTSRVNTLRGVGRGATNAAVTHCPSGHPYDDSNTMFTPSGRQCRECGRISHRASSAVISAAARKLGISRRAFLSRYGQSVVAARAILARP